MIRGMSEPKFQVVEGILKATGTDIELLNGPDSALAELHWRASFTDSDEDPDWLAPVDRLFDDLERVQEAIGLTGLRGYVLLDNYSGPCLPRYEDGGLLYVRLSKHQLVSLADPRQRRGFLGGEDCIDSLAVSLYFASYGQRTNGHKRINPKHLPPKKKWLRQIDSADDLDFN